MTIVKVVTVILHVCTLLFNVSPYYTMNNGVLYASVATHSKEGGQKLRAYSSNFTPLSRQTCFYGMKSSPIKLNKNIFAK